MKKIYIECGAHKGGGINRFRRSDDYDKDFQVYCIEPNPQMAGHLKKQDAVFIRAAVWIENGKKDFYLSKSHSIGSSLYRDKTTGEIDKKHPIEVRTIDLNQFLIDTFQPTDYLMINMDIEGAEYEVLGRMIDGSAIDMISSLTVEWHWAKLGISEQRHQ